MRPGKTVQINISIPKHLDKKLKELAMKENRSLSNLVSHLLIKSLDDDKEK